jgi:hypothetical protein
MREYQARDAQGVSAIHAAMGLDYRLPNLDSPLVAATVCEDNGKLLAAGALKIEAEVYLWVDPNASPAAKWDAVRLIHRELVRKAVSLGLEQLVAYVPECVQKFFCKRLRMLRWAQARDGWKPWVYELGAK